MTTALFIAIVISAAAGLMRGFAGMGSGMLMAPFFVYLFGPVQTVAIIIMMELVVTAQLMPSVFRDINWKVILPMGAVAALFMPVGSWLLVTTDPKIIGYAIAALVTVFSLVLLTGWRYQGRKPLPVTLGVGAISGVLMALTSLGNPPVMLYLLSSQDSAATNRANFTGYFAITLLALIAIMTVSGLITISEITTTLWLLPLFIFSAWIGSRLFRKANETLYRRIALGILLCAGVYGLIR
jgi:uncharacterized membrane protein YfcA